MLNSSCTHAVCLCLSCMCAYVRPRRRVGRGKQRVEGCWNFSNMNAQGNEILNVHMPPIPPSHTPGVTNSTPVPVPPPTPGPKPGSLVGCLVGRSAERVGGWLNRYTHTPMHPCTHTPYASTHPDTHIPYTHAPSTPVRLYRQLSANVQAVRYGMLQRYAFGRANPGPNSDPNPNPNLNPNPNAQALRYALTLNITLTLTLLNLNPNSDNPNSDRNPNSRQGRRLHLPAAELLSAVQPPPSQRPLRAVYEQRRLHAWRRGMYVVDGG